MNWLLEFLRAIQSRCIHPPAVDSLDGVFLDQVRWCPVCGRYWVDRRRGYSPVVV